MTGPLRLMTFNVQMLPWLGSTLEGTTNDAPERAERVVAAIREIPTWDRPDVIAFNEVFDEDGRERLVQLLATEWPSRVEKLADSGVWEDSGLMLFSKLPFVAWPDGSLCATRYYSDAEGPDAKSTKGVGIVQVASPDNVPGLPTIIAFTHLQASYHEETEFSGIRIAQLQAIWELLDKLLDQDAPDFGARLERFVLIGDLNIRGDSEAASDEWEGVFGSGGGTLLTAHLYDGWRTMMHPPGDETDHDRGFTNLEFGTGRRQRLDYMAFGEIKDRPLVPQHMVIRLRNASDHSSLEAVVQHRTDHCTPSTAFFHPDITPLAGNTPGAPSTLRVVPAELTYPGSFQWVYFPEPGTFTFWAPPDVELRVFAQSDLSHPLPPSGDLTIDELAGTDVGSMLEQISRGIGIDRKGTTQAAAGPFFLAVRSPTNTTGHRDIGVLEHHGEAPQTAVVLLPNASAGAAFPGGQRLGRDDWCWFRAVTPTTFAGTPHAETYTLNTLPFHGPVRFVLRDAGFKELAAVEAGSLEAQTVGAETLYLVIERSLLSDVAFSVTWTSPVSYLMLDRPLGLYVDEETGGLGSDEISFQLTMDGTEVHSDFWDDADEGERWPGLDNALIAAFEAQPLSAPNRVGFVGDMTIGYDEEDVSASGGEVRVLEPIAADEPDVVERRIRLDVEDTLGDGRYTFYCSLTRRA